jgi:nucleotide-binding universal stress UspA family protein
MRQTVDERRIVVGIDGSEPSKQALRWAIGQARATEATLDVVTAWEYPTGYGWGPVVDPDDVIKASEQILTETLTEVVGQHPPVPIRTHVVREHPAYALIQQADGAQLLAVGCRGHGGFVGALLGSVSQYCVQHATCPVVVIRGPHTEPSARHDAAAHR